MNEIQRKLVIDWGGDYFLGVILFTSLMLFENPEMIIPIIFLLGYIIRGNRSWEELKESSERGMKEFIEYANNHKRGLVFIAIFYATLPVLIYILTKKEYLKLTANPKDFIPMALLVMMPFLILDIGQKIDKYKKNGDNT